MDVQIGNAFAGQTRQAQVLHDGRIDPGAVEQNFYAIEMYRLDIYQEVRDAIAQNYRVSEVAPTGKLVLYTPR
jgi:hypothetical protein